MATWNVGDARSVTRRPVILIDAPQYAGVAMSKNIVSAVAQACAPARKAYTDAVGHRFDAASEYGSYDLVLTCVEELADEESHDEARFALMFAAISVSPPAGVYRLSATTACGVPDAQLFIAGSARGARTSVLRHSSNIMGRRP